MHETIPFLWIDVFAAVPLGGNPLAVLDGRKLAEEALLPLTRELNLSETVFLYPPTTGDADARVRIFTVAREVPFAGHPLIGAAVAVLLLGWQTFRGPETVVRLETGIGVVAVTVHGQAEPELGRLRHRRIAVPAPPVTDERTLWLPPALGLTREQLGAAAPLPSGGRRELAPQVVNGGALQLMVPVRSPEDIDQIVFSYRDVIIAERALGAELGMLPFAFTGKPPANKSAPLKVRARFFAQDAPSEDPATGSAAAALAVYLHHHGVLQPGQELEIDQGAPHGVVESIPGRRSVLYSACDGNEVQVAGCVREVLRGELRLRL